MRAVPRDLRERLDGTGGFLGEEGSGVGEGNGDGKGETDESEAVAPGAGVLFEDPRGETVTVEEEGDVLRLMVSEAANDE